MSNEDKKSEIEQILRRCCTDNLPMLVRLYSIANDPGNPLYEKIVRIRKNSGRLSYTVKGTKDALIYLGWKGVPCIRTIQDYTRCLEALTLISRFNKGECDK